MLWSTPEEMDILEWYNYRRNSKQIWQYGFSRVASFGVTGLIGSASFES